MIVQVSSSMQNINFFKQWVVLVYCENSIGTSSECCIITADMRNKLSYEVSSML